MPEPALNLIHRILWIKVLGFLQVSDEETEAQGAEPRPRCPATGWQSWDLA